MQDAMGWLLLLRLAIPAQSRTAWATAFTCQDPALATCSPAQPIAVLRRLPKMLMKLDTGRQSHCPGARWNTSARICQQVAGVLLSVERSAHWSHDLQL